MQKFEGNLTVQVAQVAVVEVTLKLGATATAVEVADVTPALNVDNPTLGHVLERQRIDQLPINGRFISSLFDTVPGLEGQRAYGLRDGSQELVQDGTPTSDRLWGYESANGLRRRPPGLDTVQEFKVENNNSSAKYSRPTTIVVSTRSGTNALHGSLFETHRNNAIGKARSRTDFTEKAPQLIRNEFGGSAGGPLVLPKVYDGRNRTFWFTAYEGYRNVAPQSLGFRVPTQAMRNGDFRGLTDSQGRLFRIFDPNTTDSQTWARQQFSYGGQANVIDPARLSPLTKYLYSITPLPTNTAVNPLVDVNYWGLMPNTGRQWTSTSRFDHRFSDRDFFYARYTQGDLYNWDGNHNMRGYMTVPMLDNMVGTVWRTTRNKSLMASWVRTISPTLVNELLATHFREHWWKGTGDPSVSYIDQVGMPNPLGASGWPRMIDSGLSAYDFESDNTQESRSRYSVIDDNMTKIHGRHEFQFGAHFRYDTMPVLPDQVEKGIHNWNTVATSLYDPTSARTNPLAVSQTGNNLANMYLGIMNYTIRLSRGHFNTVSKEYALYLQDSFKATSRLTLNMGLRWEYWPPFREKNNLLSTFDPQTKSIVLGQDLNTMYKMGATVPSVVERLQSLGVKFTTWQQAGYPESLIKTTWKDFGPRVGFAYRAGSGSHSFVVRGGYRISYFPVPFRTWSKRMRSNAPFLADFVNDLSNAARSPDGVANYGMRSVPTTIAGVNSRNAVSLNDANTLTRGSPTVSYFAPDQSEPRVHDWNLTLEKEVAANTVARVAYIGNHGSHLEQIYQYNDQTPAYVWYASTGERLPTGEYANVARRPFDKNVYGTVEEYRKTGWSNFNGVQLELERRYSKGWGYQVFYVMGNALTAGGKEDTGAGALLQGTNMFLPGRVPADLEERNRFLNYQRDTTIPKHRVRWNWIADLPFGKGKRLGGNAKGILNQVIGGWQVAGMGSLRSTYFSLPTSVYPNGRDIELYGYKYPVQDCRSGACTPGYLWWNGYIPANQVNSVDASGKPNGVMGVPASYKPAGEPPAALAAEPQPQRPHVPVLRHQHRVAAAEGRQRAARGLRRWPPSLAAAVHAQRAAVDAERLAVQEHRDHRAGQPAVQRGLLQRPQ